MNNEISGKTLLSVTASIAATIIPDTPIVSIAGATLSEITTTTTSTTTTPTPTPTPSSFIPSNKTNKDHNNANLPNNPMSDAAVAKSAGGNGTAAANNTTSNTPADTGGITGKEHTTIVNIANAGKTDDATTNTDTKKSDVSDLEEPELKKLLDEAYNYKTPKDKKDKSEIFLDLLQKVENEDLGITSTRSDSHRHHPHSQNRHQQKQGGSLQDLLQLPSDFRRQNHTSRHKKNSSVSSRQREGGSLPSNVNVANCLLSSFGQQSSVYTDKRVRRGILPGVESATVALNSNKTLVGVVGLAVGDPNANCLLSTFEQQTPGYADKPVRRGLVGGDPNATTGCTGTGTGSGSTNSAGVCSKDSGNSVGASVTSVIGGAANMATTASGHSVGGTMATGAGIVNSAVKTANSISGSSDYIINIGDMIDIQQQQQILPSKAQDGGQGLPYYERVDIDMRIPRPNLHRGEGGDFAPAHSHHYVDEVIRFHQIDGGDGSLCESGEVAISVNNIGNKHKSAAASCSLPMPLDERYQSIKSVMGEKGDSVGATLNPAVTAKAAGTITTNSGGSINNTNNNAGAGVGTNSIGIGSYTKSLPMSRQTDENGNDCERQQHNSSSGSITVSAGQSQAKAKAKKKPQKDNTIPVDVENEAGYRGKDPVEVLLKFIEEDGKQGGGGGGNKLTENNKKKERKKEKVKQNKMKKSNSLEELRSCAKIDVGELKRSAATTESNNVTMRSKGSGGGKGGKNNSASTADINKNFDGGSKEGTTSSPTTGGKQATAVATTANAMANNRKGERRSWGTEELQYLGTEGSVGGVCSNSGSVCSSSEDKAKEKKDKKSKDKEKEKDKDKERDVEKDKGKDKEKDKEKEKDSDRHDKLTNNKIDGNSKLEKHDRNDKVEKAERQEKIEKPERADKLEKRKKSESIMHTPIAHSVDRQDAGTPIFSAIDLLSMNTLISETAEFHVVTKKKKPKKQRASIDDTHFTQNSNYNNSNNNSGHNSYNNNNSGTTGGFSRAHNMVLNTQKNNNNNNNNNVSQQQQQQQQQQQSRYKYHNNNAHGFNSYGNGGGGSGGNSNTFGEDGRLDYRNNYNSNYNNNYNSNHSHQQYGYQHQQQQQQQAPYHHHQHHQQQQQQQQHPHNVNAHNMNSGTTDKSRRKSTSSVPPSEKSDSSDLDSVHSLPIESTTSSSTKNKQRHKQSDTSPTATPETPKSTAGGGSPGSAPISYAHIAAAAAADRWPSLDAANNNSALANGINTSPAIANNTSEQLQPQVANNSAEIATPASITNANNNPSTAAAVLAATANSASKQSKSKKLTIKPDFPELGCSNVAIATAPDNSKPNIAPAVVPAVAAAPKTISYSQSLVAAPAQLITASNIAGVASGEKVAGPIVEPAVLPTAATVATAATSVDRNTIPDANKVDANSGSARLSQHQPMPHQQSQQQTQPLQKSKSVEHDSYSFNSTNLDQQYPALEKTVKRHSATNVSISPPSAAVPLVGGAVGSSGVPTQAISSTTATNAANSTKFNFAAAAKQIAVKSSPLSQPILTQEPALAAAATQPSGVAATTTSSTSAAYPAVPTNSTATVAGNVVATVPVTMPVRKSKEKSPTTVFAPTTAINALAIAAVVPIATANLAAQTSDASAAVITARKSKKEKSQPVLSTEPAIGLTPTLEPQAHVAQKSSTATQTQASPMDIVTSGKTSRSQSSFDAGSESVVMPPISSKPQRQPASNANNSGKIHVAPAAITPTSIASAGAAVGTLSCNASSSRPAVIIMNDDRGGEGSAVGIEFTFGDFNEDELKFFDDNLAEDECPDEFAADETAIQQQTQQAPAATLHTGVANQQASAYPKSAVVPMELVNDNTATAYVENAALYAAVRASSPKPTFMGPPLSNVPVAKDIVHIVKTPSTAVANVVNNTVEHVNVNDIGSVVVASATDSDLQIQLQLQQQQQLQRRNSETQKLQQLETCNDIETAIIAAARAAAEQQHQQPMQPPPPQQQRSYRHKHQQQYRSTSYGNAYEPPQQREQRSQSAYTRDTSNNYQQQQQQHHYHSQYHQQQQHYHYHQSGSSNSASRSRSSSSNNNNANAYGDVTGSTPPPQSPNATAAVVVNIQRKEFDIHFIPPTVSNAYNALQHNEIIVDFIGSAWEEVAKVTKFYEGQ